MVEDSQQPKEQWDYETQQNWDGFWDLILKEDMRQNPNLYKSLDNKNKDNK